MKHLIWIIIVTVGLIVNLTVGQKPTPPTSTQPTTKPASASMTPQEEIKALKALVAKQALEITRLKAELKKYKPPTATVPTPPSLSPSEIVELKQALKNSVKDKKDWTKKLEEARRELKKVKATRVSTKPVRLRKPGRRYYNDQKQKDKAIAEQEAAVLLAKQSLVSINSRIKKQRKDLGLDR